LFKQIIKAQYLSSYMILKYLKRSQFKIAEHRLWY